MPVVLDDDEHCYHQNKTMPQKSTTNQLISVVQQWKGYTTYI
jgi:hypothetical protein